MRSQSLTSLKDVSTKKTDGIVDELAHLQTLKREQSKQLVSEIRALTVRRNFLLKQIKELYGVVNDLAYRKEKITKSIDSYAESRLKAVHTVGGPNLNVKSSIEIDARGIINL